jgi:T5SS/PEP-CTERM-associated repeat protein
LARKLSQLLQFEGNFGIIIVLKLATNAPSEVFMSKKLFLIIAFILLAALAAPVLAVSRFWTNDSGDGLWSTASNWSPSGVPVIGLDKAVINKLPGPLISSGMAAEAQLIALSDGAPGALQMTGGTLNVGEAPGDSWFIIAYGASDVGTFTLDGGAVTTSNRVFVGFQGQGTLDMNGGTFDIGGTFGIGFCDANTTTGEDNGRRLCISKRRYHYGSAVPNEISHRHIRTS